MSRVVYYHSWDEDMVQSRRQNIRLSKDYDYVRYGLWNRMLDWLLLCVLWLVAVVYVRLVRRIHIHGRERLRPYLHSGLFLYGNHTQPVLDPFIALLTLTGSRPYGIVSTANFGIPLLGRLMPWCGALPAVHTPMGQHCLTQAVYEHIRLGHPIVVYPEAHVWQYCTQIRPFSAASFAWAVETAKPAFAMTTVYRHKHPNEKNENYEKYEQYTNNGNYADYHNNQYENNVNYENNEKYKKYVNYADYENNVDADLGRETPRIDIYIDGPFFPDDTCPPRLARQRLCAIVREAMLRRAAQSDYAYIRYLPAPADSPDT